MPFSPLVCPVPLVAPMASAKLCCMGMTSLRPLASLHQIGFPSFPSNRNLSCSCFLCHLASHPQLPILHRPSNFPLAQNKFSFEKKLGRVACVYVCVKESDCAKAMRGMCQNQTTAVEENYWHGVTILFIFQIYFDSMNFTLP